MVSCCQPACLCLCRLWGCISLHACEVIMQQHAMLFRTARLLLPMSTLLKLNNLMNRHTQVNQMLGKPLFDCSRALERWRDGPADETYDCLEEQ